MVFFVVAAAIPGQSEDANKNTLQAAMTGNNGRNLGNAYEVKVTTLIISFCAGGQVKVQDRDFGSVDGVERDAREGRSDARRDH